MGDLITLLALFLATYTVAFIRGLYGTRHTPWRTLMRNAFTATVVTALAVATLGYLVGFIAWSVCMVFRLTFPSFLPKRFQGARLRLPMPRRLTRLAR